MSIDAGRDDAASPWGSREILDLTGLPAPVADELRKLVATLRETLVPASSVPTPGSLESPGDWLGRLQAWVDTHPVRSIVIDDDRDGLYSDRGG
jgi:hypothetical protein